MSTPDRASGAPTVRLSAIVPSLAAHAALMALHATVREVTAARTAELHPFGRELAPLTARREAAEAAMLDAELTYAAVLLAACGFDRQRVVAAIPAHEIEAKLPGQRTVDAYVLTANGAVVCGACCALRIDQDRGFDAQARYSRRKLGTRCAGVPGSEPAPEPAADDDDAGTGEHGRHCAWSPCSRVFRGATPEIAQARERVHYWTTHRTPDEPWAARALDEARARLEAVVTAQVDATYHTLARALTSDVLALMADDETIGMARDIAGELAQDLIEAHRSADALTRGEIRAAIAMYRAERDAVATA